MIFGKVFERNGNSAGVNALIMVKVEGIKNWFDKVGKIAVCKYFFILVTQNNRLKPIKILTVPTTATSQGLRKLPNGVAVQLWHG